MLDIDLMHEHDSLRAVPFFHVLEAFLLRINYKRYLLCLFYDFEVVEDVLILVNAQLSEDDCLLVLHEPVDIVLVESQLLSDKDVSDEGYDVGSHFVSMRGKVNDQHG